MAMPKIYPLIFTDLDGTLLDHHSYSSQPADALIKKLHDTSLADVIPVTSKTQAELSALEQDIHCRDSVKIFENGSVVCSPLGFPFSTKGMKQEILLGVSYDMILRAVANLPPELGCHINGFANMTVEEVVRHTGLSLNQAAQAKERQATEPFLWSGSGAQMSELRSLMAKAKVRIQQGGRFYHFTGYSTKEDAVQMLIDAYRKQRSDYEHVTIVLGDGPNDLKMIEMADYGVIIPNTDGAAIQSNLPNVRIAEKAGPKGWVTSVTRILNELGIVLV